MLLTHIFFDEDETLADSSEAVLTSLLVIYALTVSKMYPPVCNLSQICTLFKNMFYLPKLVPATAWKVSKY